WSAWVDARLLVTVPDDPPAAGPALARTADPRPLIARAEDALGRYRRAVEELTAGRADGEVFRRRTRGLRVGMSSTGSRCGCTTRSTERWVFCDGVGLATYAASAGPSRTAQEPSAAEPVPEAEPSARRVRADAGRAPGGSGGRAAAHAGRGPAS
ncbi:hypothetical protein, partial [Streptomyces hydrogenans]|uniref:hypothetical protein n=1 Tax=Streptomyces hydrogenans TaxID=1873719 RepID=UPI003555E832